MFILFFALLLVLLAYAVWSARQAAPEPVTWHPCQKHLHRSIVSRAYRGDLSAQQLWDQARVFDDMQRHQDARHLRELMLAVQLAERINREERQQADQRRVQAIARTVPA